MPRRGVKMGIKIEVRKEEIAEFCQRNRIRRLALFGSVLRDDFTPGGIVYSGRRLVRGYYTEDVRKCSSGSRPGGFYVTYRNDGGRRIPHS